MPPKRARKDEPEKDTTLRDALRAEYELLRELAGALSSYLVAYDCACIRDWYRAHSDFARDAAYRLDIDLDDLECLPDQARYPVFFAVYAKASTHINRSLKLIGREPLPKLSEL